ncbi:MAG: hypothetical protein JOZ46_09365, partial [Candidatus Dormibacteraeota bacterium]|nr:hypothetical protein [Candidatus Dormibacteraeota bacterium]
MSTAASSTWTPTREQAEGSRLRAFLRSLGVEDVAGANLVARAEPERFWAAVADDIGIDWQRRFDVAMDTSEGLPWTRFWVGGELNFTAGAVDRWAMRTPDHDALVWEGDDGEVRRLTYRELRDEVARAVAA